MQFEISNKKLEREQEKRLQDAKRKREREQRLAKEQAKREEELAKLSKERKMEQERLEELRLIEEEAELQLTGGIKFCHALKPYLIEGEDDKILLPEEYLTDLNNQDVFGRGAVYFRLTHQDGRSSSSTIVCGSDSSSGNSSSSSSSGSNSSRRITHCGVREFTAPPGRVGLSKKIVDSLFEDPAIIKSLDTTDNNASSSSSNNTNTTITVKYVKLPKCTAAKLQPKHNRFAAEVMPIKMMLEENLRRHSTLSVGDQLTVWYRGKEYVLCVVELVPAPYVSLLDTDVEIDLDVSQEYAAAQQQNNSSNKPQPEAYKLNGSSLSSNTTSSTATDTGTTVTASNSASVFSSSPFSLASSSSLAPLSIQEEDTSSEFTNWLQSGASTSFTDGGSGDDGTVQLKIKLPSGKLIKISFPHTAKMSSLFKFVAVEEGVKSRSQFLSLQLAARFPTRTWTAVEFADVASTTSTFTDKTLSEAGLAVETEALFASFAVA